MFAAAASSSNTASTSSTVPTTTSHPPSQKTFDNYAFPLAMAWITNGAPNPTNKALWKATIQSTFEIVIPDEEWDAGWVFFVDEETQSQWGGQVFASGDSSTGHSTAQSPIPDRGTFEFLAGDGIWALFQLFSICFPRILPAVDLSGSAVSSTVEVDAEINDNFTNQPEPSRPNFDPRSGLLDIKPVVSPQRVSYLTTVKAAMRIPGPGRTLHSIIFEKFYQHCRGHPWIFHHLHYPNALGTDPVVLPPVPLHRLSFYLPYHGQLCPKPCWPDARGPPTYESLLLSDAALADTFDIPDTALYPDGLWDGSYGNPMELVVSDEWTSVISTCPNWDIAMQESDRLLYSSLVKANGVIPSQESDIDKLFWNLDKLAPYLVHTQGPDWSGVESFAFLLVGDDFIKVNLGTLRRPCPAMTMVFLWRISELRKSLMECFVAAFLKGWEAGIFGEPAKMKKFIEDHTSIDNYNPMALDDAPHLSGVVVRHLVQQVVLQGPFSIITHIEPVTRFGNQIPMLPWYALSNITTMANYLAREYILQGEMEQPRFTINLATRTDERSFREVLQPFQESADRLVRECYRTESRIVADMQEMWIQGLVSRGDLVWRQSSLADLPNFDCARHLFDEPITDEDEIRSLWSFARDFTPYIMRLEHRAR